MPTQTLPAGSSLLLYTDGLGRATGETLDDGLRRLLSTIEHHAHEDFDGLCDAIVSKMMPDANEDDVAIVAVRPLALTPGRAGHVVSPVRS